MTDNLNDTCNKFYNKSEHLAVDNVRVYLGTDEHNATNKDSYPCNNSKSH